MTSFVLPLDAARDASIVGGKGASLGSLCRAGFAVPPGFVVTADAFTSFMAAEVDPDGSLRAGVEALPAGDLAVIGAAAGALRERITSAPLSPPVASAISSAYTSLGDAGFGVAVAVRSSATAEDSAGASFAGLQDTYLSISGVASVLDHVRRCWASLYNDESVAYRRRIGLPEAGLAMAVVVQRMVAPKAAGVMFTRSPVTGDRSVVAIEGTPGLGSALVAGEVTPDSFVISKITAEITSRRVQGQACLTDDEIRALAVVARRVEAHFGVPQDIEWALLDDREDAGDDDAAARIVLLQSRPETVWAARADRPAAAPKPRPADHVLSLFGKPL